MKYRMFVSGGIVVLFGVLGFHIALECGYIPILFPGFANAATVRHMAHQVDTRFEAQTGQLQRLLVQQFDAEIFATREAQCKTKSDEARESYTQRLQGKLAEYLQLTGHDYRLPGCGEF